MSAVAVRHVHFEDLGSLAPVLTRHGYDVTYIDAGTDDLSRLAPAEPDVLVVLGAPIGVYEQDKYPFLRAELALLNKRLAADRPTLGICLGSQLIAHALGARVYPMGVKEIGFAPVQLTAEGSRSCLSALAQDGIVLHWHGDTFDLPEGAARLASTPVCTNQAFAYGPRVLGLQFHIEVLHSGFERWLIGHACELTAAGCSIPDLRAEMQRYAPRLASKAQTFLDHWLDGREPDR
jgi:GMP synthase (glutamine-hydrolysing)